MSLIRLRPRHQSGRVRLVGVLLLLSVVHARPLKAQWQLASKRDEMTDEEVVALLLPGSPVGRTYGVKPPVLALRCRGHTFDAFFDFGVFVAIDDEGLVPTSLRFDAAPLEDYAFQAASDHQGAWLGHSTDWVEALLDTRILRVQVPDASGTLRLTRFATTGLKRMVRRLPCLTFGKSSDPPADTTTVNSTALDAAHWGLPSGATIGRGRGPSRRLRGYASRRPDRCPRAVLTRLHVGGRYDPCRSRGDRGRARRPRDTDVSRPVELRARPHRPPCPCPYSSLGKDTVPPGMEGRPADVAVRRAHLHDGVTLSTWRGKPSRSWKSADGDGQRRV